MSHPENPSPVGDLVVRNGRQKGTRVHLRSPLTVIGSDAGCDLRLTAEGIGPVHCVVVATPAGPFIRAGAGLIVVNGEAKAESPLADGDEVKVGPCVFRVAWAPPPPAIPEADTIPTQVAQLADHL